MIIHNPLHKEMQRFFDLLSDFKLADDEEIGLCVTPYVEDRDVANVAPLLRRCRDMVEASRFVLRTVGLAYELYVVVVRSGSGLPKPEDIKRISGIWEMRQRKHDEENLQDQDWRLQDSPSGVLLLTCLYPLRDNRICEAAIYMDRSRYRGPAPLDIFDVLRDRVAPFSAS